MTDFSALPWFAEKLPLAAATILLRIFMGYMYHTSVVFSIADGNSASCFTVAMENRPSPVLPPKKLGNLQSGGSLYKPNPNLLYYHRQARKRCQHRVAQWVLYWLLAHGTHITETCTTERSIHEKGTGLDQQMGRCNRYVDVAGIDLGDR